MLSQPSNSAVRRATRGVVFAQFAALCLVSSSALAAVVDSGPVNIPIPDDIDGVYLNVVTGAAGVPAPAGYDVNPYSAANPNTNFNLWGPTANTWFNPQGVIGGNYNLPIGTVIQGAAAAFFRPAGGTNVGTQVTLNSDQNFFGFRFVNEANANAVHFGYIQVAFGAALGSRSIVRYAFENVADTPITVTGGAVAPTFSYNPASGSTVPFTGGGLVGTTGNASIAVSINAAGSGSGAAATTTTTCTAPTAPFSGFGQTVTAVGNGAISGSPLSGSCTLGNTAATQTLTCSENRGGTPTAVTFTLSCPAGTQPPLTSTPASGATITLPTFNIGGAATSSPIAFQNPGSLAATVNCTAPTATQFSVSPLSINVPAGGSASTTVSFSTSVSGPVSTTLNCSAGGQQFSFTLNGNAVVPGPTVIPTFGDGGRYLLILLTVLLGMGAIALHNRRG